jgi:exodeoxyribonuclease VII large subunit
MVDQTNFFTQLEDPDFVGEDTEQDVKVYSVSELNSYIKGLLESTISEVWIKAEISNFKAHTSGHFYFSLKDEKAQVNAVMFRGANSRLKFRPEDGMEVMVLGRISVYEPRGTYQVYCESMEPVGAGALQVAFEQLKAKLQGEGLFDPRKKRAIPAFPRHLAIVTSPTGAAIRDLLNVLSRRFRGLPVTIGPCKVQGKEAPGEIVEAIRCAQLLADVDVIIVGRGGGSIEDLWAFNDEKVARAVSACRVPVISGVGHEVDFTICDFVADLRAPTPSAAAELVVKNTGDLLLRVATFQKNLISFLRKNHLLRRQAVDGLSRRLVDPQRYLQDIAVRIDDYIGRLGAGIGFIVKDRLHRADKARSHLDLRMQGLLKDRERSWGRLSGVLDALSPLAVVARGYSLVKKDGEIVKDSSVLKKKDILDIQFARGNVRAEVIDGL